MTEPTGVALVTGSTSGIGAAVARRLAGVGMTVVVNSRSSTTAGETLAAELPGASYLQADVADAEQAQRLVSQTVERHGRLDLVVNNAGITQVIPHADLATATPEIWRRIFDVNVVGTWQVSVAAVPHLRASGAGSIVNISSIAGIRPIGSSIPYGASKAAVNQMTRMLAAALGPEIRVNAVAPGMVETPWTADWDTQRASVRKTAPLRRTATPDDVAELVLGLVRSTYVTGEVVLADGGLNLR